MDDLVQRLELDSSKAVIIADQHGLIIYVNLAFEQLFGWMADEVVGQSLLVIIPTSLHDAHNLGFSRFLNTETPTLLGKPLDLPAITKEGVEFTAVHQSKPSKNMISGL